MEWAQLEAEVMLPSQMDETRSPSAVLRLTWAVFEDAVDLLLGNTHSWKQTDVPEAEAWLESDETCHFSFLSCCEILGFSPSAVRKALLPEIWRGRERADRVFRIDYREQSDAGVVGWRMCRNCHKEFEILKGSNNRAHCSTACRVAWAKHRHRAKKERYRQRCAA